MSETSFGKVYNVSDNSSTQAQLVAASLMKDLGTRNLRFVTSEITYAQPYMDESRNGAFYNINAGFIKGLREKGTFVAEGSVSGTWNLEGSPYYIEGPLLIENNQTLNIEEGVKIAMRGPYAFVVKGNIMAQGTEEKPIQFSASNPNIYWGGFDYDQILGLSQDSYFKNCIFQYSQAKGYNENSSGGVFNIKNYDGINIYNSLFGNNMANGDNNSYHEGGGAIALWNASPVIVNCIFYENYAVDNGGAILAYMYSNPIISNCLFYDNESEKGGAIAFYYSDGILINSTLVENRSDYGGGLFFYYQSNSEIINNIIWNNEASNSGNQAYLSTRQSEPGFYYCDIEEGASGFGGAFFNGDYLFNMDEDPMFEENSDFNFLTGATSPCMNQGTSDTSIWFYSNILPETCLCGTPRILDGHIEIGPYERLLIAVQDLEEDDHLISISPNPVLTSAQISYDLDSDGKVRLEIYNIMGQKVNEPVNTYQLAGKNILDLPLDYLEKGHYLIKISTTDQTYLSKFIKY